MFKKLVKKLNIEKTKKAVNCKMINPLDVDFDTRKSVFLNKLSKHAVDLYEKQSDIKKFTKLVLAGEDDTEQIMDELFNLGVTDPFADRNITDLSVNSKLLKDLNLDT